MEYKELMEKHNEGQRGVENLARLCRVLGYRDPTYFGQFDHDGSYGDLINFLEDNSGAVEAIKEFIQDHYGQEFEEEESEEENEE